LRYREAFHLSAAQLAEEEWEAVAYWLTVEDHRASVRQQHQSDPYG